MVLTVAKPGAVTELTGPLFTVESDRFRIDLLASDGTKQGHHQLRPYWIRYFLKQSFYQTFARLGLSRHTYHWRRIPLRRTGAVFWILA